MCRFEVPCPNAVARGRETVSNPGGMVGRITADQGIGMKWRVIMELTGNDGTVRSHEVSAGGTNGAECSAATVGLTLADGKRTLAGLHDHLVRAQAEEYCRQRRLCSRCGLQRPLKDVRARRLLSVFGTVEVRVSCCRVGARMYQRLWGIRAPAARADRGPSGLPAVVRIAVRP